MGTNFPQTTHFSLPRKQFLTYALYALVLLALLHYLLFNPLAAPKPAVLVREEAAGSVVSSRHGHAPANAHEELPPPPPIDQGDEVVSGETQGTMFSFSYRFCIAGAATRCRKCCLGDLAGQLRFAISGFRFC
jgi:hypothetical protein